MKRIHVIFLSLLFILLSSVSFAAPQHAFIAAAADGPYASSNLSQMAGRAPFFVYFDSVGNFVTSEKNPFIGDRAAGPQVVQYMANRGIKVITAGDFGGHMQSYMLASGIKVVVFKGKASEAVKFILKSNK